MNEQINYRVKWIHKCTSQTLWGSVCSSLKWRWQPNPRRMVTEVNPGGLGPQKAETAEGISSQPLTASHALRSQNSVTELWKVEWRPYVRIRFTVLPSSHGNWKFQVQFHLALTYDAEISKENVPISFPGGILSYLHLLPRGKTSKLSDPYGINWLQR